MCVDSDMKVRHAFGVAHLHVGSRDGTQVVRLGGKYPHLLSHLAGLQQLPLFSPLSEDKATLGFGRGVCTPTVSVFGMCRREDTKFKG